MPCKKNLRPLSCAIAFLCAILFTGSVPAAQARSSADQTAAVATKRPHNFPDYAIYARDIRRLLFHPPTSLIGETELACLAVAVYHEARGEELSGQEAVASVIIQRAIVPHRWGRTPCAVVKPVQFSFMKDPSKIPVIDEDVAWALALTVAVKALVEGPAPDLRGADHYHAQSVSPDWPAAMEMVDQIGDHIFYRDPLSEY